MGPTTATWRTPADELSVIVTVANVAAFTQDRGHRRFPRALQVLGTAGCAVLVATLPVAAVVGGVVVLAIGLAYRTARLRLAP